MKEIERAIEQLNRSIEEIQMHLFECDSRNQKETVYYRLQQDKIQDYLLARSCLQSKLERQENKALTLSELKEMVGEPVWIKNKCYILIHYHDEDFIFLTQKGVYISNEVTFSSYMYEKSWIAFRCKEEHK